MATAPILILIGAMMMTGAAKIDWADARVAVPGFLTIMGMPFTFSITDGISLGIVSYTLIMATTGKAKEVHLVMYILTVSLVWKYFV